MKETLKAGTGKEARNGQAITVHYVGKLESGTVFDDSRARGQGFTFRLGENKVIEGWNLGLVGIRAGEVRRITLPPSYAYGARGAPPVIPPNATVIFEVECLELRERFS
jgi:FKBP-type peptidyl-prolyl cis-trans isomerase